MATSRYRPIQLMGIAMATGRYMATVFEQTLYQNQNATNNNINTRFQTAECAWQCVFRIVSYNSLRSTMRDIPIVAHCLGDPFEIDLWFPTLPPKLVQHTMSNYVCWKVWRPVCRVCPNLPLRSQGIINCVTRRPGVGSGQELGLWRSLQGRLSGALGIVRRAL